ncbi:zinc-binding alcohol dehydrogenase family protein [Pedobacter jeongneungensis]|uniref:quinone oxidoreductase family protein n=1 Tax=Pedobacter jeongneungensis TaxID=947309 RepID=UPI00046AD93F|nr:zinc-binding alcohol dehydrogenase family protein [Pedobacter jeongneungensis]
MKSLALFPPNGPERLGFKYSTLIHHQPFNFGILKTPKPIPDDEDKLGDYKVLVSKKAISINFRDLSMLFTLNNNLKQSPSGHHFFGSDFVAEVVGVGKKVRSIKVGDRVIPNCDYFIKPLRGVSRKGIPSNRASMAYEFLLEDKLIKIDDGLSDEVAASISIGLQTSYAMIRKAKLKKNSRILVTSGSSNTSLFIIEALRMKGYLPTILTSSLNTFDALKKEGNEVVLYNQLEDLETAFRKSNGLNNGFDVVFDPFSDVFFEKLLPFVNVNGKYITCGLYKQKPEFIALNQPGSASLGYLLAHMIMKNVQLIGNCLGNTRDLLNGIEDLKSGRIKVNIENIYQLDNLGPFIEMAFNDKNRMGKVVLKYA